MGEEIRNEFIKVLSSFSKSKQRDPEHSAAAAAKACIWHSVFLDGFYSDQPLVSLRITFIVQKIEVLRFFALKRLLLLG
jgi:hypothetical protein